MTCRRQRAILVMLLCLIPVGVLVAGAIVGFRFNMTPSYPPGVWRIQPLDRDVGTGDLIFICPPGTDTFELARERGYLGRGFCPGWFTPLIKMVVAVESQHVEVDESITVDGELIAQSDLQAVDAEGRAMQFYAGGIVPTGHLFLHSEFAGSYDSRYFGPIPDHGLLGRAVPVFTFTP